MALAFSTGSHHLNDARLAVPIEINDGATVYAHGCQFANITINNGSLYTTGCIAGTITLAGTTSQDSIYGTDLLCTALDLTGGQSNQRVMLDRIWALSGIAIAGAFGIMKIRGAVLGQHNVTSTPNNLLDIDGVTGADIEATIYRAAQIGARIDDCVACSFDLKVIDAGASADDTYDAISVEGSSDQLDIRGAVRGAISQANGPRYGIQVGASATAIDLWLAYSGTVTGDLNDLTSSEVTTH